MKKCHWWSHDWEYLYIVWHEGLGVYTDKICLNCGLKKIGGAKELIDLERNYHQMDIVKQEERHKKAIDLWGTSQ